MLTVRTGALLALNQTIAGCVSSGWALAGAEPDDSRLRIVWMGVGGRRTRRFSAVYRLDERNGSRTRRYLAHNRLDGRMGGWALLVQLSVSARRPAGDAVRTQ